jgi:O-antigen/teichoic acid export membrane protein
MTDLPLTPVARKLVRNTILNYTGQLWTVLTTLFLMPYMVAILGPKRFGVWALVLVLVSYLSLLDLGVGAAFVKHIAEYNARQDEMAINGLVSAGVLIYLVLSVVIIALVAIGGGPLLYAFRIPPELLPEARTAFLGAAAVAALSGLCVVFQAVTVGLQRMEVSNVITVVASLPVIIGTVLLLRWGYGLGGLVIAQAAGAVVTAVLSVWAAFWILPRLQVSPRFWHAVEWGRLFSFGAKVQISRLAELASSQADKLLLGYFVGLNPVTFYDLGAKIVRMNKSLSLVLVSAIVPAASELTVSGDQATLRALYRRGSRYLVLLSAPSTIFIVISAPLIVQAWIGPGYEAVTWVIRALAIGHFVHLLTGVGTTIAQGIGQPEYETRYTLVLLVLQTTLGIILIARLGLLGALIATPVALVFSSIYFIVLFHRLMGLPLIHFAREVYWPPLAAVGLACPVNWGLISLLGWRFSAMDRMGALLLLVIGGLVFSGTYAAVVLRSGYLDAADWRLLRQMGWTFRRIA